jgi:hypothetical protein
VPRESGSTRIPARGEQPVGLLPIADDVWLLKYGPVVLSTTKGR